MNEDIQTYLMEIISRTDNFIVSELPDIANQILIYGAIKNTIFTTSCLAVIVIIYHANKYIRENYKPDGHALKNATIRLVWFVPLTFLSALFLVMSITSTIKIIVAPKLYLLSYAANLVSCS